jgi:hypothetical protein
MAVNVLDIKDSLLNLLNKNNTVTSSYDISAGIYSRIQQITGANSEKQPVLNINYPAVFVEVKKDRDKIVQLGMTARRNVEIDIDIVPVIDYGIAIENAREESDNELVRLSDNIKNLIRNYITLSTTVDSMEIAETTYDAKYSDNVYNANSRISLLIKRRG